MQKVEKKSDAQLAREIEVALPVELSREEQITLLQNYIAENFTSAGMCADMAIHEKHVDGKTVLHQNPHAHILLTTRGFKEDDFKEVADIISAVVKNPEDAAVKADCAKRVHALCVKYPLYEDL